MLLARRMPPRGYRESKSRILLPGRRMAGFFKIEVIRPDGGVRLDTGFFHNLITNSGLDCVGVSGDYLAGLAVGTGNSTPTVDDTTLDSELVRTQNQISAVASNSGSPDYYTAWLKKFRFGTGAAAGNLAEVGMFRTNTPFTMFSRALILDGDGDPTTITVLEDEALDVTYEWRNYPILGDVESEIEISGETYACVTRPAQVTNTGTWGGSAFGTIGGAGGCAVYNGSIGAITASPSGDSAAVAGVNSPYGPGNYYRDYTCTFDLITGNLSGGISAALFRLGDAGGGGNGLGAMQCSFDPPIPKTGSNQLSLQFRHSWARKDL